MHFFYLSKQQAKNQLFSEITSSRWQEENNRLPFSLIGIDDQGLEIKVWVYFFLLHMLSFSKTEIENRKRFFKGLGWCILWLSCQNEKWVPGGRNWLGCWRWRCWCRATNLSVWFMQEKIGFWFSHHVSFKFRICWLIIDYGLEEIELCFRAGLIT